MTPENNSSAVAAPAAPDFSHLRVLANEAFGKAVDWDMRGLPITDCDVLMHGAYRPAVIRLVNLALARHDAPLDRAQLLVLAPEAFAQAEDRDFANGVITDYKLVLQERHGYGGVTLGLVNLALAQRALRVPAVA